MRLILILYKWVKIILPFLLLQETCVREEVVEHIRLPSKNPSFNIMQNYTARNKKVEYYASISHLAEWMGSWGISAASYSMGAWSVPQNYTSYTSICWREREGVPPSHSTWLMQVWLRGLLGTTGEYLQQSIKIWEPPLSPLFWHPPNYSSRQRAIRLEKAM